MIQRKRGYVHCQGADEEYFYYDAPEVECEIGLLCIRMAELEEALTRIALKECRCIGDCDCKIDHEIFRIANHALSLCK